MYAFDLQAQDTEMCRNCWTDENRTRLNEKSALHANTEPLAAEMSTATDASTTRSTSAGSVSR